jgi:hypothetical protein
LTLILMVGALLRLDRFQEPHPSWGYDPFWELMEARNTAELGHHALLFQLGGREPLFNYLLAGLWWVFPEASPYIVSRVVSVLLDALAVGGLYLLGKEAGGRRVGLLAAGLAAASKPMMIMTLACTRGVAVTAAAAFLLLFTLRVLKRPDPMRFLPWGLALGASLYTYTGVRPLWLWIVLSTLLFAWWRSRADLSPRAGREVLWAVDGLAVAGGMWVLLGYLRAHAFMGWDPGPWGVLGSPPLLAFLFLSGLLAWALLRWGPARGRATALVGWAQGTFTACLLAAPLVLHREFARHLGNDSILTHQGEKVWAHLPAKIASLFTSLFLGGPGAVDRYDLNILGDAHLDLLSIPVIVLGLALWVARRDKLPTWLVGSALAGIFPLLASQDAHSVKLLAGLPALFTLAALAIDRVWGWVHAVAPGRRAAWGGALSLTVIWALSAALLHGRVWGAFAAQRDANLACAMAILKEPTGHRIYLAQVGDFFLPHQQNILLDGRDILTFRDVNPIPLVHGEKVPTVVVFFPGEDEYDEAKPMRERLAREFPGLPWREYSGPGWHRKLLRLEVPPGRVEARPDLFPIRRSEGASWRRVFLRETYGLGRGGYVTLEERVPRPDDPVPQGPGMGSCRLQSALTLPRDGTVELSVRARSWLVLSLEGKEVLRHRPGPGDPPETRVRVRAKAGERSLDVRLQRREEGMPMIEVAVPGTGAAP